MNSTDFTWLDHDHDFELHTIVFLDQESESPVKIGYSHHISIDYYEWGQAEKIDDTHPVAYVAKGSHAADKDTIIPGEDGWDGNGASLKWDKFRNIFILHTNACKGRHTVDQKYCNIIYNEDLHGYHFWWNDPFARDWRPKEFPGVGAAPWHRYTWDEPTMGDSRI